LTRFRVVAGVVFFALTLFSQPASAQLAELETEDLRLIYFEATQGYLAPHVVRCFENSMDFQKTLWGYLPTQKTTVFLNDFSDRGNAGAGSVPRNILEVKIAPLNFAYEIISANERMNWIMNHELVHIVATDKPAASDRKFRRFFGGKVAPIEDQPETILYTYLTNPRNAAPRWYQEGIAVFVETWMAGGVGRAQGPWDEMVFRSMVRDGSHFYDPLGLVSEGVKIDFQVEVHSYLYGTRFMTYLAHEYGPQSLIDWVGRRDGSKRYYAKQFRQTFGLGLDEAWQDWIEFEHDFQQANLEKIQRYPITPADDISDHPLGSVSRAFYDPERGRIYAAFNYPGVVAHIGSISINDGSVKKIVDVKGPVIYTVTSMAYDPEARTIFYTTDNLAYRDIRAVDPETGKSKMLLKDDRIGELVFNTQDRSLWGVRHFNGIATLVRIPHPYEKWQQIYSWPYGEVLYDLDISPDGRLLSGSVGEINGHHTLRVMEIETLLEGDPTPLAVLDMGVSIPSNFVFSPDGKFLFGSSYYTGVSNIFRWNWDEDALEAVSNTDSGFFRPIPLDNERLIVFRYTGEGFIPTVIDTEPLEDVSAISFLGNEVVEKYPLLRDWIVGSPMDVDVDERVIHEDDYHGFKSIGLESAYPVLQGYRGSLGLGYRLNFSDPMMLNQLSLTAAYTPDTDLPSDERIHARLQYERYNLRAALSWNTADFYDVFGPTYRGFKGYSADLGWSKYLVYDKPRRMQLELDTAFYGGLEQVPGYQNIASPYDTLWQGRARLHYEHVRSSLGAVAEEKGHTWEVVALGNYVNSNLIPLVRAGLDIGFALPIRHSSIWLRTDAGYAHGDADDPFAFFFFGGFGNNYVDKGSIRRYHEWYSFPGVELNAIGGQTFSKALLEWNLPPIRFRRVGWTSFFITWIRPSIFTSGLVTSWDDRQERREFGNAGVQLDLRFTIMSRLNMTLSTGYARAFSGDEAINEFMVSLKIL
jgi:hypothetical protein